MPNTQVPNGTDTNVNPPVDGVNPPMEELDAGGLPSAQVDLGDTLAKFSIDSEFATKNFKDGKLYGRFDSLEAVLNTLHSVETKYSNLVRDVKSGTQAEGGEGTPTTVTPSEVNIYEVAKPVISKFVENNFSYEGLEADITALSEQTGKSPAEIKLAAYEMREQITALHAVTGGKENYDAMLQWGRANLTPAESAEFDKGLVSPMNKFVVEGLYARYKAANPATGNQPQTPNRIQGDNAPNNSAIRPYQTMSEIAKDRAYLSGKGRNDTAAKAMHQKRLALTPDSVVYGR